MLFLSPPSTLPALPSFCHPPLTSLLHCLSPDFPLSPSLSRPPSFALSPASLPLSPGPPPSSSFFRPPSFALPLPASLPLSPGLLPSSASLSAALPTPQLDHFIAYALHHTCLHPSVTFAAHCLLPASFPHPHPPSPGLPPCLSWPPSLLHLPLGHPSNPMVGPFYRLCSPPHLSPPISNFCGPLPPPSFLPLPLPSLSRPPSLSLPTFFPLPPPSQPPFQPHGWTILSPTLSTALVSTPQ
jgi:hypothetical protein